MKLSFNKSLIIHHWDTDGLCSAALILQQIVKDNPSAQVELRPPLINNYFLTELERIQIQKENFDCIIVVDLNFNAQTISQLQGLTPNLIWFDHHLNQVKKTILGLQDPTYLSCSHLITDYFKIADQTLAALGLVGDQEEKVKAHPLVKNFANCIKLKQLIDSSYIIGDYAQIKQTIRQLAIDPWKLLDNPKLNQNIQNIEQEEAKALKQIPEVQQQIYCYQLESPYNSLSAITRKLAKLHPDKIILNIQQHNGSSNLYVRTARPDYNLKDLIEYAKGLGYSAGGKKEVMGVVLPTAELNDFKEKIINKICQNSSSLD